MKILIIASEAPPIVSGISRCVERMTVGLQSRGHTVDVISAVDVPRVAVGEFRFSSFGLRWPKVARRLSEYDVVNLHGPTPTMSDVFLLLSRSLPQMRRPRVVYTHHSAIDINGLGRVCAAYNCVHDFLARVADRVVVSSQAYYNMLARPDGPPVDVVPWGVDLPDSPWLPQREAFGDRLRVLFVGQMRPYKGVDTLLRAVAGQRMLDLTLVGSGPLFDQYRSLAAAVRAHNTTFVGRVSDEELRAHYASHDVVVLPSTTRAEAFGLVLLEGMGFGCVPIASDLPGVREVASPTGFVVPPRDHSALRCALLSLAADPVRLRELQRSARAAAIEMTWDRVAQRYEQVFLQTMARWHATQAVAALPGVWSQGPATLNALVDEFDASHGSLLVFRRNPRLEVWAAWGGVSLSDLRSVPPRIASHAAITGRPQLLNDTTSDIILRPLLRRSDVRSAMVVPFAGRRHMVGVVNLSRASSHQRNFTANDLKRLVRRLSLSGEVRRPMSVAAMFATHARGR
jgi:glycosyltransferase involved in cell wall biosynthesis